MVLSQKELRQAVDEGAIRFDPPLEDQQFGEASIDLRLGYQFTKLKEMPGMNVSVAEGLATLGMSGFWDTRTLKDRDAHGKPETFCLEPGEFVLGLTHEKIHIPRNLIALVEGRSTYARVGLSMHQTAPWIQPGWEGPIVLEIMNNGPLSITLTPCIDRPCQVTFFPLSSELPPKLAYGSRDTDIYQGQDHPLKHK